MGQAIAFLLLGAVAWLYAPSAGPNDWWAHGVWCAAALAVGLPMLWSSSRVGVVVLLTDHRVMFLAAFCLYFAFGAGLLAVGPGEQVAMALQLYPTDPPGALRVDAINGLGFGVALLASTLSRGRWLGQQASILARQAGWLPQPIVVGVFLTIGVVATVYTLSYDFGLRSGAVPGSVLLLTNFSLLAVFMAAASRGRYEWPLRFLGIVVAMALAFSGMLQLMKQGVLLPLVALTAGLAMRFRSRLVLIVGLAAVIATFLAVGSVVNIARSQAAGGTTTIADRWSFVKFGWAQQAARPEKYAFWPRLCYVPTQKAALDFYDSGNGDGLHLVPWALVPRALAPNKPIMTEMFMDLHVFITGSTGSSTAPGVFVSGYYHAGWQGVLVASLLCGWILAQTSAIARAFHKYRAQALLPLSLMGAFIAFRIDGDFIPDYVGNFAFILYPLLAISLLQWLSWANARYRSREGMAS